MRYLLPLLFLFLIGCGQGRPQKVLEVQAEHVFIPIASAVAIPHFVSLSWTASVQPPTVSLYDVYRAPGNNPTAFKQVGSTVSTIFTDNTILRNHTYFYEIKAQGSDGLLSDASNIVTATIP